ncbi:hypothetical protein IWW54_006750 [Coemansia sp. RSA 2705]|nr:hypothetical protein IWW54_006750 [Coemansia sp. RSA 2705]
MAPHLTSLHLGGQNGYITDDFVDQLAHGLRNLRQINVFDCERLTDRTLLSLATYCPKLEAADISKSPHFSSIGVVELVRNCTGLKYLDISRIAVTDHVLAVVGNTLRELETLIMAECPRITSEGIVSAIEGSDGLGCQFTLQRLSFSNCPHVEKSMVDWCKQRLRQDAIVVW